MKGTGFTDELDEGVEHDEKKEKPHEPARTVADGVENFVQGHFACDSRDDCGNKHDRHGEAGSPLEDDAVGHHGSHGD